MGHVRDYSIGDAYARFQRARGDAVLFGFGFDAFGLPAELAAIERQVPPAEWVVQSGERMLGQMKRLGYSSDYGPRLLQLRRGPVPLVAVALRHLARGRPDLSRRHHAVDWCDSRCRTTLAALQVEDGRCWRCHKEVRLIRRPTWFLRVAPYLEENDRNLAGLEENWDELSLKTQRYILGRTDGVEVALGDAAGGTEVTVFTPHREAVGEARASCSSRRATPRSSAGRASPRSALSSTSCARAAGSAAPATPRRFR